MNTKKRRATDSKEDILKRIVRAAGKAGKPFRANRELGAFIHRYYENVAVEDLRQAESVDLAAAALSHLELGNRRRAGTHCLRVYNPTLADDGWESTHTIIELVNDDMPFLVDSIGMAIERAGLGIHLTIHPLMQIKRGKTGIVNRILSSDDDGGHVESFIRCEIDRISFKATFDRLNKEIEATLSDVRAAVEDWADMREKMRGSASEIDASDLDIDPTLAGESAHLLSWMAENHFTFLGYQEYSLKRAGKDLNLLPIAGSGLGLLRDSRHQASKITLTAAMKRHAVSKDILIITKANSRSTVHRSSYLDYVGVKLFNKKGKAIGERRFLGLFTSQAYSENPRNIPLLRLKVHRILERAGLDPSSHRGKALAHILDSFPRDELLQSSVQDLARTTSGILNLQDRRQVRLFIRRDTFRRFFSCLVYVPRDKYNTRVRLRIESILKAAFDGSAADSTVEISDSSLARLHTIVRATPGATPKISIRKTEAAISQAVITWQDLLRDELVHQFGEEDGLDYHERYAAQVPLAYEEDVPPAQAARDLARLHRVASGTAEQSERYFLARSAEDSKHLSFKVSRDGATLALSDALPILENLGVRVLNERPYGLKTNSGGRLWIQDFELEAPLSSKLKVSELHRRFAECFDDVLNQAAENDGFNQLIVTAELDSRQVSLVRTFAKYLLQLGLPFSQNYMESVLASHRKFAQLFIQAFQAKFDPTVSKSKRTSAMLKSRRSLKASIRHAKTLDEDRILRAFTGALDASVRTNYFRRDPKDQVLPVIALKLMPSELDEAPKPRPKFEIFIYSPRVEGVHLRAGDVARGGIRWSDRREDFRTEVLGLMKAQTVKNTVIVPTGSKGGFVAKQLPDGDRASVQAEVIRCYKMFIGGLLDVTDNLRNEKVCAPPDTVRHDQDDPYLVVAADKGTAAFSDIANSISEDREFWLDDAFASGGSAGYDHKKMGITARGAWEAVRRHFRELGINTQKDEFTVVGIGDMAGDVFGNGMLLSKTIRLVAAFNHMHIFIDPNPDAKRSFRERQRLFRKSGSSWTDYDESLISRGGGVFDRNAKSIPLSPEIREWLETDARSLSPLALINLILKAKSDLLWNGGIGTYVKADAESHAQAGDRANDNLRINASELQARVVGEGGNLGLTQAARIQYALAGGKINTDFIDNSAGVDSSDREVNIKILLGMVAQNSNFTRKRRNSLLAEMTDSVADLVLRNNYLQTLSISMVEFRAVERLQEYTNFIRSLENSGQLNRELEGLPNEDEIKQRRRLQQGLTRPELAVLLSYAKIDLFDSLAGRTIVRQRYHVEELSEYFPPPLPRRYSELLTDHRLSNQILATMITNSIVNRMGPVFVRRIRNDTGASAVTVARVYAIVRRITDVRAIWKSIEELDNKIEAGHQYAMMFEISRRLRHACYWLIKHLDADLEIDKTIARLEPALRKLYRALPGLLTGDVAERLSAQYQGYLQLGAPDALAKKMSTLSYTTTLLDIVDIADGKADRLKPAAKMYFALGRMLELDWLKQGVDVLKADGQWQALARSSLRDSIHDSQRQLCGRLVKGASAGNIDETVNLWIERKDSGASEYKQLIAELKRSGDADYATLSVAIDRLRQLTA